MRASPADGAVFAAGEDVHWVACIVGTCLGLIPAVDRGNEARFNPIAYTSFECVTGGHELPAYYRVSGLPRTVAAV